MKHIAKCEIVKPGFENMVNGKEFSNSKISRVPGFFRGKI
jgi:hypothetical protein